LKLRLGQFFNEDSTKFLMAIDECRFYMYDSPDLINVNDDGDICRRLLSAFSLRPISIKTFPLSNLNFQMTNPYISSQLMFGEIDEIPIFNFRIPVISTNTTKEYKYYTIDSDSLKQDEAFIDPISNNVILKRIEVINTNGLFIVYVPRRVISNTFSLQRNKYAFHWDNLPLSSAHIWQLNALTVKADTCLKINNFEFHLKSVVYVKTISEHIGNNQENTIYKIVGSEALISDSNSDWLIYHPTQNYDKIIDEQVNKSNQLDNPNRIISVVDFDSDLNNQTRIENLGTLYIYVNQDEHKDYQE